MASARFFQVGGSVRDEILGLKSKDIDYAVEAESFDAMRAAIIERQGTIYLETPAYLTIRAKISGLGCCDYVLCRKDGTYSDGRRPDSVTPGTIYDDLARRDFTVNAIGKAEDGTLLDPHKGQEDLRARRLRCVGDPKERFIEDGLRLIRALRFSITKGLEIDESIEDFLIDPDFLDVVLRNVSLERVREELTKCFAFNTPETLSTLIMYADIRRWIFREEGLLWLKPTLETRR